MANMSDAAARWLAAMQNPQAAKNYSDGVNAYQGNPMAAAADAQDRYLAGVQDAVSSGRMKAKLMSIPASAWKTAATQKGAQRLASGAQAAQSKVAAHFQRWGPVYQSIQQTVAAMPKGGLANAMARVQAAYTALKQAAGKSV